MKPYLAKKPPEYKWLRIKFPTHKRLAALMGENESFDAFLNRLAQLYEEQNPE